MRDGWEIKKLGEVCDFQGGSQPPKEEWVSEPQDGYVRMLQIRDFTQSRSFDIEYVKISNRLKYCKEDDVLLGRYGASVGKVLTGLSGAYNVAIMKTIPNYSVLCNRFFKYFLQSPSFQTFLLQASTMRAAQAGFSKEDIQDYPIPVPPLAEQEHIVAELDLLSGIIEKQKQQLKEYDTLAQSIFYTMFGDPITNEKGWEQKKLKDLCPYITDGSHYSPKDDKNGTIPMLSVKDMQQNSFSYDNCKMISEDEYQKLLSTGCKPSKGDVLIAKDGSYFKYIFAVKEEKEQALLSSIAITRPNTKILNPEYLVGYLSTKEIYYAVERELLTGTAIKRVVLKGLRELKVCVPPLTLQQEFAEKIEAIEKQKELIKQSLAETETLFNSRMDYYFN